MNLPTDPPTDCLPAPPACLPRPPACPAWLSVCTAYLRLQGQISMLGGWMDRILSAEDWTRVSKQRAGGSRCALAAAFAPACLLPGTCVLPAPWASLSTASLACWLPAKCKGSPASSAPPVHPRTTPHLQPLRAPLHPQPAPQVCD